MDNSQEPFHEEKDEVIPSSEEVVIYPPKYQKPATSTSNIWLRSLLSLALYLIIGYYIFPSYKIMLLITAIVMIHELGHFIAMKIFRYNDLGIFFIPLLGAYVSGSKREVSQRESTIILLAGPLPSIMIGIGFYLLWLSNPYEGFAGMSSNTIAQLFVVLNLFNLLPVYPLDGGQLLNRVFLNEDNWLSKAFIFLSIGLLCWFAWKLKFPVLYIFPAMMIFRLFGENKLHAIEKRIETEGINTDLEYDELPDEDYWRIRNILIEMHPSFKDVPAAPPYEYDEKEDKIMAMIQSLLHRHLIQDVSVFGKIFIFLLWAAAAASPWLLDMDMTFFRRLSI
ncbi:MAG TPA: site-2 protease family protein [Chitinophagaceae bacterium]|nr:site-2 protease family protein [Chitinophagaceae bacterium]